MLFNTLSGSVIEKYEFLMQIKSEKLIMLKIKLL